MDMLLSGDNGTDVCKSIKQSSPIPIMMISAHPNAKEICLAAGADEFIAKPFDMQDMLSRINHLMQSTIGN
jgi:DNA-binding response OmpR family regulator